MQKGSKEMKAHMEWLRSHKQHRAVDENCGGSIASSIVARILGNNRAKFNPERVKGPSKYIKNMMNPNTIKAREQHIKYQESNILRKEKKVKDVLKKVKPKITWLEHVKEYAKKHNVPYKTAMKEAKATYKK